MEVRFCDILHPFIAITVYLGWLVIVNFPSTHLCKKLFGGVRKLEVFQVGASKVVSKVGHVIAEDTPDNNNPVLLRCGCTCWVLANRDLQRLDKLIPCYKQITINDFFVELLQTLLI